MAPEPAPFGLAQLCTQVFRGSSRLCSGSSFPLDFDALSQGRSGAWLFFYPHDLDEQSGLELLVVSMVMTASLPTVRGQVGLGPPQASSAPTAA